MLNAPWTDTAGDCGPCSDPGLAAASIPFLPLASENLYNLTEGAYPGVGTDVIRPPTNCGCGLTARGGWSWDAIPLVVPYAGGILPGCGCSHLSDIALPLGPAVTVTEILIDGVAVDAARYRIDQHQRLVWVNDSPDTALTRHGWPLYQRLDLPPTEQFTWQVTYTYGTPPPPGGVQAARIYACEMALGCGDEDQQGRCRLPRNTVSVNRKNVATVIADPEKLREAGETGIPEVDDWIRADRWGRQHRGATVLAPATRSKARRRTG